MKIKQRHFIKSSEIKNLVIKLRKQFEQELIDEIFPKKCTVEKILTELNDILYAVNNELILWESKDYGYVPVLTVLIKNRISLKTVVVDKGSIRFITNKADIMRPGITQIDPEIKKKEIIQIVDETHNRALAVGRAMFDAAEMEQKSGGKVIKNIHTIKDSVWNFSKEFK